MNRGALVVGSIACALAACVVTIQQPRSALHDGTRRAHVPSGCVGNASMVRDAYEHWKAVLDADPEHAEVTVALGPAPGMTARSATTNASLHVDFSRGRARFVVDHGGANFDAWLVVNVDGPGRSVALDDGDRIVCVGRLTSADDAPTLASLTVVTKTETTTTTNSATSSSLDVDLRALDLEAFDVALLTPAGGDPRHDAMLVGHPSVFERTYRAEQNAEPPTNFDELVDRGEALFFNETFGGNGRTCGTCHPAENNFTLDAPFIDHMKAIDEHDPLFVAEFVPELMEDSETHARFETPELMHRYGLITVNPDGFDDLAHAFVLRAVPHLSGLNLTTTRPMSSPACPSDRLGWAGDGAPGGGSLREFALGAVTQHFTRRMSRVAGVDYRWPTDAELDALEAFLRSIGRSSEIGLKELVFQDGAAERARRGSFSNCEFCHQDAGANDTSTQVGEMITACIAPTAGLLDRNDEDHESANSNFDTGVEAFTIHHPDDTRMVRPVDGGLGVNRGSAADRYARRASDDGGFDDGTFNMPSLVEFADTTPGFHNHVTASSEVLDGDPVESAVRFYLSVEFGQSAGGREFFNGPIPMSIQAVKDIARLLRAINALENARSAIAYVDRALTIDPLAEAARFERTSMLADAEAEDGHQVLEAVLLSPDAAKLFHDARSAITCARDASRSASDKRANLLAAREALRSVRAKIVRTNNANSVLHSTRE